MISILSEHVPLSVVFKAIHLFFIRDFVNVYLLPLKKLYLNYVAYIMKVICVKPTMFFKISIGCFFKCFISGQINHTFRKMCSLCNLLFCCLFAVGMHAIEHFTQH